MTDSTTTRSTGRWVLVLASVASLVIAMDLLVVSTALSTIRRDLDASVDELQWTVNAYGLSFASLLLTGAALGDRFGRRRVFAIGLGLFAAASAACALTGNVEALIAARVVQGAGAALVIPLALALVNAAYPAGRRGSAIGILEGVTGLATIGGPIVGGAIAQGVAWQWIFWVNVPICLVAIPFALTRIEESYGEDDGLDIAGMVLVAGASVSVVWGLVRSGPAGWDSLEVVGSLAAGLALGVAFVARERQTPQAMLPLRLFRRRQFSAAVATSFFQYAALYGSVFFMAQLFQTGLGYAPLTAGLLLVPWTACLLIVAPAAGRLADRIGERPLSVAGLVLNAAGLIALALVAEPGVAYSALIGPLIVVGVGTSMAIPVVQSALIGGVDARDVGKASGANNTAQELGGAFGVAILVAVFATAGSYESATTFLDGFTPAILTCAGLAFVGAAVATALPRRLRRSALEPAADDTAIEPAGAEQTHGHPTPHGEPQQRRAVHRTVGAGD